MLRHTILVACVVAIVSVAFAAPAAAEPFSTPWREADEVAAPFYQEMDPLCADLKADLVAQGVIVDHPPQDPREAPQEKDPMESTPECADLRDELERVVWEDQEKPYAEKCRTLYGKNCVAVGHEACDFAFLVGSGLVYYCWGGIFPDH